MSGGNAGLAVAYAGRRLGARVTVVVPETTDVEMQRRIAAEEAEVLVHGAVWDVAHQRAMELVDREGGTYVSPFDHPDIRDGHATLVEELAEELGPPPGLIVVAVGGGGLLCGVLTGLHRVGWTGVPVLAVETESAASLAAACKAGELVSLAAIESIATSLGALRVASEALAWTRHHEVRLHQVRDAEAVTACLRFADDHRLLVEPACGAALAPLYRGADGPLARVEGSVVVVVCGGAGVSLPKPMAWCHRLGLTVR